MRNNWEQEARQRRLDNEEIMITFWICVLVFVAVGVFGAMIFKQPIMTLTSFATVFLMFFWRVLVIKYG